MTEHAHVVVIGGGPAGLAAATEAARTSGNVVLIDSGPRLGGQFWRHGAKDEGPAAPAPRWHHDWSTYRALDARVNAAVRASRLRVLASTHVFAVDVREGGRFVLRLTTVPESFRSEGTPMTLEADAVVLCTGAYDRQLPVPGWTLPGVMAAGGVQAFVKVQEHSPGRRVLLAGTGPFLLAAACSVLQAGGEVVAICESADLSGWFPHGISAGLVPSKMKEGAEYAALLARHRVPYLRSTVVSRVLGEDRVQAVEVSRSDGRGAVLRGTERVFDEVDIVGLGWGFVPQVELLVQMGAATRVDIDGSLVGVVDGSQASSLPGLFLAGEITGVTGAMGAVAEGRIAGRAAVGDLRRRRRDASARARHRVFARTMHRAHPAPDEWIETLSGSTIVCRCEEVTLGELRVARDELEADDPRSLKGVSRAGMGLCQGRMCGAAMLCLRGEHADSHEAARAVGNRPLALPISTAELADSPDSPV